MACPTGSTTGFIQLNGGITDTIRNQIQAYKYPLSIAFAPRTTVPTLTRNQIDESFTGNTCTHNGNIYTLCNIQLCKAIHKGYYTPDMSLNKATSAEFELVMTFQSNNANASSLNGIFICVPIYQSDTPNYNKYLDNIICNIDNSCGATEIFTETLETLFYKSPDADEGQSSFIYKTCITTTTIGVPQNKGGDILQSNNFYVVVMPYGINLSNESYSKLIKITNKQTFSFFNKPPFILPVQFRNEVIIQGIPYNVVTVAPNNTIDSLYNTVDVTSLSTSDAQFINKFEYCILPAKRLSRTTKPKTQYTSSQYKCVPFNKLTNGKQTLASLGNNPIINTNIPLDNAQSLDTILKKNTNETQLQSNKDSKERFEENIVASYIFNNYTYTIVFLLILKGMYSLSRDDSD